MASFKDGKAREWIVELNLITIRPMKAAGFDVYELANGEISKLQQLVNDPSAVAEWVWALIKPQAEKLGIGFDDFAASLAGDALGEMQDVFFAEYLKFCSNPKIRAAFESLLAAKRQLVNEAGDQVAAGVAELQKIGARRLAEMRSQMTPAALEQLLDSEIKAAGRS